MARTSVAIVFAGSGGAGAMTAGAVLLRAAAHAGYYGLMTQLFGPQVRGGEAAALVQISTEPIEAQPDRYDLFVALDWEKVEQFSAEIPLDETSVILADPEAGAVPASIAKSKARVVALAMSDPQATRLERGLQRPAGQYVCRRRGLRADRHRSDSVYRRRSPICSRTKARRLIAANSAGAACRHRSGSRPDAQSAARSAADRRRAG